jgi:hypothetical protein
VFLLDAEREERGPWRVASELAGSVAPAEIAGREPHPAPEGRREVGGIGVAEPARHLADPSVSILEHLVCRRAARLLEDVAVGQAGGEEAPLERPHARPHPGGDHLDVGTVRAGGEQIGQHVLDAMLDVGSG